MISQYGFLRFPIVSPWIIALWLRTEKEQTIGWLTSGVGTLHQVYNPNRRLISKAYAPLAEGICVNWARWFVWKNGINPASSITHAACTNLRVKVTATRLELSIQSPKLRHYVVNLSMVLWDGGSIIRTVSWTLHRCGDFHPRKFSSANIISIVVVFSVVDEVPVDSPAYSLHTWWVLDGWQGGRHETGHAGLFRISESHDQSW